MHYHIRLTPEAQAQLAQIWISAANAQEQQKITDASIDIDRQIAADPKKGYQPRNDNFYYLRWDKNQILFAHYKILDFSDTVLIFAYTRDTRTVPVPYYP